MKFLMALGAFALTVIGVFAAGGALEFPREVETLAALDPATRAFAGVLAIAAIGLALRLWLRVFGIEPGTGLSSKDDGPFGNPYNM